MGSSGLSKECRSLSDALDRGQGSMGWAGGGCQVSRLSRRQLLPCSAGRIPSGFLLFPAFPMGLSVGKVQSCPYNELSACDSYIVAGLVCLQVNIFKLSLFPTEDGLGVTVKT